MANPKLESVIRIDGSPTACTIDTVPVPLNPGDFVLSSAWPGTPSFLSDLQECINAVTAVTYTVSMNATGQVTITNDTATAFTLVWSDGFGTLLGFSETSYFGLDSYESEGQSTAVWYPECPRSGLLSPESTSTTRYGKPESDAWTTRSPSGYARSIGFSVRYVDNLEFPAVLGPKAWREYEVLANESFQTFWESGPCFGLPIRYYPDATDNAVYQDWQIEDCAEFRVAWNNPTWFGAFSPCKVGPYRLLKFMGVS